MNSERSRAQLRPHPGIAMAILAAALAVAPMRAAYAYIDPNSAGPLYQFLFPLFIAVAGALAALRRIIRQAWGRAVRACSSVLRRGREGADGERLP